ncbi:MAG TPA: SDR family oxidoreductase [Gaiellaceae bacterium]|jgi:NAD(P)-dependent dehydrogenase (short-subunit alcohol dehydrogenase family)
MRAILVTGGSAGIGRAIVDRYAQDGARVLNLDVNPPAEQEPGHASTVLGDVSVTADIERAVTELATSAGQIDVLVCNAGIGCVGGPAEVEPETFDRLFAVNVRGVYLAIRASLPWLERSDSPAIAVISSNAGLIGRGSDPFYSATKWALNGLVRSLAISLAPSRIRINAVCPGPVSTPELTGGRDLTRAEIEAIVAPVPLGRSLGRIAEPSEIAAAVHFLCSSESAYVTGALFPVDGGKTAGLDG